MSLKKSMLFTKFLMVFTAVAILVSAIIFKQSFLRALPLFVSLFVMYLNSAVDRSAFLVGGLNSILYAFVYFTYRLYASAGYALLISFPLQIISFFRWRKQPYQNTTMFKSLSRKQRILLSAGFVICWIVLFNILSALDSSYLLLDNTITLLGILATVLTIFAYIEYTWITLLSNIASVLLYITMLNENPEQITYLIFSVYSVICVSVAVFHSHQFYKIQQSQTKN